MQTVNININNYEPFILDYLEGNLDESQSAELRVFLEEHPSIKAEVESFDSQGIETTYLSVPEIEFPHKSNLYRRPIFSISSNPTLMYGIAACFVVLLGFGLLFRYQSIPTGNSSENTLATLPPKPIPSTLDSMQEMISPSLKNLSTQNIDSQASIPSKIIQKPITPKLFAAKTPVLPKSSSDSFTQKVIVPAILPITPEITMLIPKITILAPEIALLTPEMQSLTPSLIDTLPFSESFTEYKQFVDSLMNYSFEDISNYTSFENSPHAKLKTFARKIMHIFYRQKYEFECKYISMKNI